MIPQEMIDMAFEALFGTSEPGASIHELVVISGHTRDIRPETGIIPREKLKTTMCAITPEVNLAGALPEILQDNFGPGHPAGIPIFALVVLQANVVLGPPGSASTGPSPEVREAAAKGLLHQHPDAAEVTTVYAACRDGRRWQGIHFLTGPMTGTKLGPDLIDGTEDPGKINLMIRRLVGI